jgi:toxin ParE1/3/4
VKRYRVVLSRGAFQQLAGIEDWIGQGADTTTARRYREAIIAHCQRLERYPNRGTLRDDLRPGLRTIVFRKRVTIGYIVVGDEVQITGIVSRGRDIGGALVVP